jgi:hypothetical protein
MASAAAQLNVKFSRSRGEGSNYSVPANVAQPTLDAISVYDEDVRAGRQIKNGNFIKAAF